MPVYPMTKPIFRLPSGKEYPDREDNESEEDYIKRMWKIFGKEIGELGIEKAKEYLDPIS